MLVSLWDIDDFASRSLITAFYRHLAAGAAPGEALRRARSELFESMGETRLVFRDRPTSYAHPRFWSAFVLIGEPSAGLR